MSSMPAEKCKQCSLFFNRDFFCSHLSPDELTNLSGISRTMAMHRGEAVSAEALKAWPIIAVASGVLSIQHLLEDGRRSIAAFFMAGDIIDFRSFADHARGQVIALSKANICRLSPQVFKQIVKNNPDAQEIMWENLRNQSFRAMDHSSDLAKKRALEKLASFLFECRCHYTIAPQGSTVSIPVRRIDLADYLGMQPETVSRCFRDLEEQGIIEFKTLSSVTIKDVPLLRQIANGAKDASAYQPADKTMKILRFA